MKTIKTLMMMAAAAVCFGTAACGETVEVMTWLTLKHCLETGNDVKLTADIVKDGDPILLDASDTHLTLDLNGHEMSVLDEYMVKVAETGTNITFTLKDSGKERGAVYGSLTSDTDIGTVETHGEAIACVLVGKGGTFVFESGVIDGFRKMTGVYGSTVVVEGAFKLTGGTIYASKTTGSKGAGVYVKGGTFIMSDGAITHCEMAKSEISSSLGGGVYVDSGATFEMTGGRIFGCIANQGGGVAVASGGTFNFSSGRIIENKAREWGSGVYLLSESTMSFSGGAISNNATYAQSLMGAGIVSSGKLTMTGGTIAGNTCQNMPSPLAIYSNCDVGDVIYGGVVKGAITCADDTQTLSVYGGVFDCEQTDNLASGKACTQVGANWIVGTNISSDTSDQLTAGTYTFNPTNAEYVAAGVEIADDVFLTKNEGTPLLWTLLSRTIIEHVPYVDENGQLRTTNAEVVVPYISRETWEEGWYVVTNDVTITGGVDCFGAVKLILADGAKLTIRDVADNMAGIGVSGDGNSFMIYDQAGRSGALTVTGGKCGAGIGGGYKVAGSNITVNGGRVTATGGDGAAGIGGGYDGNGSNIHVADNVVLKAGNSANPTEVIAHTSILTDVASLLAGKQYAVTSSRCQILAEPTQFTHMTAAVYTNGFLSTETTSGSGQWYVWRDETATVVYTVDDGYYFEGGATVVTNALDTSVNPAVNVDNPPGLICAQVPYVDEWGKIQMTTACVIDTSGSRVTWNEGWYVVESDVTITGGADCSGAVKLILADDAKLTISGVDSHDAGIGVTGDGNSFTVYSQVEDTGVLTVAGGSLSAGIGGGWKGAGSNITINGGTVTATGGNYGGAGIGGGDVRGAGLNITVNAGKVTATGGTLAAGIGGGSAGGAATNITINGGTVTATGGNYGGTGIGAGYAGDGSQIYVADHIIVTAGKSANPTEEIPHASPTTDIAASLADKRYAMTRERIVVCYSWLKVKANLEAGNDVMLGADVEQGEFEGVTICDNQTVKLDLNGFKLTSSVAEGEEYRPFLVGPGHFTLTDTKGGGVVDGRGGYQIAGSMIYIDEGGSSFTLAGGTITGFAAVSAGGAVFVNPGSSFTMNGGTITNCLSANEGGAVYNYGTATVNGGVFVGNVAGDPSTAIFGGNGTTIVNGGVSDSALIGEKKASDKDCTKVGDLYIVGTNIACDVDNRLTAGTYTFNPTDAEYVAAGVEIADDVYLTKNEGTPLMWTLLGRTIIEHVPYVDENGQVRTTNAEVVVPYIRRETWEEGWYVVTNDVTITGGVDCSGAVKLILADGAKLTIRDVADNKAGIGVSGDGNSFTVYAQTGGSGALTVTGGKDGAGIGGGLAGSGSGITINGGWVTATGGENASGIGGGHGGAFSGIYVANNVIIRAGNSANPTEMIPHASPTTDIASSLAGKRYAKTEMSIEVSTWAALKSNLEAGNGVRLMENVTQDVQGVAIGGKMVLLDLNGFTILGSAETAEAYRPFTLSNGANLTLADYSTGQSGTIDGQKVTRGYVGGCVYVGEGCAFTMNGGTVTNFVADCGGAVDVENGGTFNLSGGTIVGNASTRWGGGVFIVSGATMSFGGGEITCNTANGEIGGGGICSSGKLTMTGGRIVGNQSTDNFASTAIYSNLDDSDAIYGGVIDGTICRAEAGDLVIFGGVFGCDQTSNLASGKTCVQVGANWIVGTNIACDANNRLTDGSYTFCPTNALYVAAGVEVSEVAEVRESEVEPKAWSVSLTTFVAAPTQFAHMTAVVCTNGFLSSESAPGSGLWHAWTNETATVIYTTDPGYCFEGGATAATNNLDTTVNPAVNKDDPPELLLPEVEYVDEKGVRKIAGAHIVMMSSSRVTWTAGWYAVTNDVTISGGAECSGAVKLILADGAKLTINGVANNKAGIAVSGGSDSFTVYGQAEGTGSLEVPAGYCAAGIGGGCYCSGANITINGGTVTATGSGAGIGGGLLGSGSYITINGGKVTAAGGTGAGIGGGGGREGSNITINGGVVTATGGANSAGIGGGSKGKGSNITINGGTVTATGGGSGGDSGGGAGIGGGSGYEGANIMINGGTVTAAGGEKGGTYGAGIGGGSEHTGWSIFVADNVCVKAGDSANPTEVIAHASPTTDIASLLAGKRYATAEMVITYPSYLEGKSDAVKDKFDAWAATFGSRDPDGVYTNAFLLNVATNNQTAAEEAFAIGSITVTNGVVDVELPKPLAPATSFNGDMWLQCTTNLPAADWKDVESGRYIDEKGSFLRCLIDFEHQLDPADFPKDPTGTKTLKVLTR